MLKFLASIGVAVASIAGLIAAFILYFLVSTPQPNNLKECLTTEMFKVHLCSTDANYVALKSVAPVARNAIIVSEDGTFYSHHGFDWSEMEDSVQKNWERGAFARGGSTLTQQLSKNVYLSFDKSLLRKAREALITYQIEQKYSKDEILEKYLNVVQFGKDLYGIKPAAAKYFGKTPAQLNASESAFLAFLLPSPEKYSVSFQRKKLTPFARSQMRQIVDRLARYKKISEDDHAIALAQIDHFFGSAADMGPVPDDEGDSVEGGANSNESPNGASDGLQNLETTPEPPSDEPTVEPTSSINDAPTHPADQQPESEPLTE